MNIFEFMDRHPVLTILIILFGGTVAGNTLVEITRVIVAGFMK
ncbi:hypothetical protein RI103_06160 [Paraburkholderia sp. FT54]|nr:hypothetical protein [Paraburkholderia sp. FT54]WNC90931.1 hypothetical protein RI103_06160 [Paraburkholderia sp. FT54]